MFNVQTDTQILFYMLYFAVHPSDNCRLDLIIPGEQHFYVRGSTPSERQQWLAGLQNPQDHGTAGPRKKLTLQKMFKTKKFKK